MPVSCSIKHTCSREKGQESPVHEVIDIIQIFVFTCRRNNNVVRTQGFFITDTPTLCCSRCWSNPLVTDNIHEDEFQKVSRGRPVLHETSSECRNCVIAMQRSESLLTPNEQASAYAIHRKACNISQPRHCPNQNCLTKCSRKFPNSALIPLSGESTSVEVHANTFGHDRK